MKCCASDERLQIEGELLFCMLLLYFNRGNIYYTNLAYTLQLAMGTNIYANLCICIYSHATRMVYTYNNI